MSSFLEAMEAAAELAATLGVATETIVGGEALAAVEGELAALSLEGYSLGEGLSILGISGEHRQKEKQQFYTFIHMYYIAPFCSR